MNRIYIILFLMIFLFAIFLRLYHLDLVPPGINRDEGSIAFTAYSLLLTGKDEYGRSFPLSFQSFGDWKLPLYIYTVIPFVALFGMSELAVRLPSALFGIITVLLSFFVVKELLGDKKIAFLTMTLIAISPWHLHLSRVESESNTAVLFTALGLLLFLKSIKGHKRFLIPSFVCFALTYYTYAGNHVFTTLLVGGLLYMYRFSLPKSKITGISLMLFFTLSAFIFYHTIFIADKTKFSGIGIFADPSVVHAKIEIPRNEHQDPQSPFARIVHNRVMFGAERFIQNYLNAFSPQFLFITGGENRAHNILNFGNMYLVEAPFLFLGILYLLTSKKDSSKKLILWWFFIAPVAASITKDAPHTNRMFAIFPMLPLVTALGISYVVAYKASTRLLVVCVIVILFAFNMGLYIDRYYTHFPRDEGKYWGIGYKALNEALSQEPYKNKKVIISRPQYSPYIFLLFYGKIDPLFYQKDAVRYPPTNDGFYHVKSFGRFEFREINWGSDMKNPNTILVDDSLMIPEFVKKSSLMKKEISLPNGESMFTIVETL